jgi:hypothetical protein
MERGLALNVLSAFTLGSFFEERKKEATGVVSGIEFVTQPSQFPTNKGERTCQKESVLDEEIS